MNLMMPYKKTKHSKMVICSFKGKRCLLRERYTKYNRSKVKRKKNRLKMTMMRKVLILQTKALNLQNLSQAKNLVKKLTRWKMNKQGMQPKMKIDASKLPLKSTTSKTQFQGLYLIKQSRIEMQGLYLKAKFDCVIF